MGLLLDIVPNHMGVGGADNPLWLDVLENGRASKFAEFFDIDWEPPDAALHGKMLAPFLGAAYGDTLANGELVLKCIAETGQLYIEYHEHHFPISPRSAAVVLHNEPAFKDIARDLAAASRLAGRRGQEAVQAAKAGLAEALQAPDAAMALAAALDRFATATPEGQNRLHELLQRQNYRLAWWRAAADEINWRRFFDINTLAGVRVEVPRVFERTHRYILELYAEGLIDGVRIDHIDGLADPRGYARKLRRSMETAAEKRPDSAPQGAPYIVVEKILAPRERLPADWQTDGTTGYDFMDQVGGLLHDPAGEAALTHLWMSLTGRPGEFSAEEEPARRQILRDNLASELNGTAALLHRIARHDLTTRDYTLTGIRRALTEILMHFPVYRIYAGNTGRSEVDAQVMERALAGAHRSFRRADEGVLDVVRRWLVDEAPRDLPAGPRRAERLRAMVRFQQLSAPTAAKSVEDTAFYRFGRLLSRNEVGSSPDVFAYTAGAFHAACLERARKLPGAMLATATHDHKRGEDSRARLAVLSEIPDEWETALTRWMRLNAIIRKDTEVGASPSPADEVMLYQTLVSSWPLGLTAEDAEGIKTFSERVAGWMTKSLREAKLVSEWAAPNEAYEAACQDFLTGTLDPSRPVLAEIIGFAQRLGLPGAVNGLAQTLLRFTTSGVPDLYQGTEFWDQSLVDPDNRRPVDFAARQAALAAHRPPAELLADWRDGAVKQAIIQRALQLRQQQPALFADGDYVKLEAHGPAASHIFAHARRHKGRLLVAAVSRLAADLVEDTPLIPAAAWAGTSLTLPAAGLAAAGLAAAGLADVLNGGFITGKTINAATLFAKLPVALLASP